MTIELRGALEGLRLLPQAMSRRRASRRTLANDMVVRRTFEAAGVEFIDENGGGPGVRLKKRNRLKLTK